MGCGGRWVDGERTESLCVPLLFGPAVTGGHRGQLELRKCRVTGY